MTRAAVVLLGAASLTGCEAAKEAAATVDPTAAGNVGGIVGGLVGGPAGASIGEVAGYTIGTLLTIWGGKKAAQVAGRKLKRQAEEAAREAVKGAP